MLRQFIKGLRDIVYPKACLACKTRLPEAAAEDKIVCSGCWSKIKKNVPPFCFRCGRHLDKNNPTKNICSSCVRQILHFDRAFSPCIYDGVVKDLIHAFKYRGKDHLGKPLSRLMVEFIKEFNLPLEAIDLIVPVPLHKSRLREREFNQAEILSRHISREFNKNSLADILKRKRNTQTQTGLEPQARFKNVKDSFQVSDAAPIKGKNILLVDDVFTTGATCSEAAYALKQAGAGIVFVLTLAN